MESALRDGAGEPGLKLIETMLWDGRGFPHGPLHLHRLLRSCARLGWAAPSDDLLTRYPGPPADGPAVDGPDGESPARVRLTVDASGVVGWQASALPPALPAWRLGLANERLCSTDPWLTLKSTRRGAYDRARAALPAGLDEVVFLNERGEVCDGSITTLFFDRGDGMRTPPLASGLLPGVLRAALACPEAVLLAEDLPRVRLWLGNAVRGLAPAVWRG